MPKFRKLFAMILLCLTIAYIPTAAAASADTEACVARMIQYYLESQENAEAEITAQLDYLYDIDSQQGRMWSRIMTSWSYHNSEMSLYAAILPDGLPQDDSLCIVILGYGLNADGSMKKELVSRLKVGLASAQKYPNAYVAVTGGATSNVAGVTEAGQMAAWLKEQGLFADRLIVEEKSYSTIQNAENVYRILCKYYPTVDSIAVVTSDYHARWGCTLFSTVSHYNVCTYGGRDIAVVSNAINYTGIKENYLESQAQGICAITGISFPDN